MNHFRSAALLSAALVAALACSLSAADRDTRETGKTAIARGTITAVDPDGKRITLHTRDGKDLKLYLDDRSSIELEGRAAKLDQFKKGMHVRVRYEREGDKARVVALMGRPVLGAVRREVLDALRTARAFAYRQRDEYRGKMEAVLDDLDEKIGDLQDRVDQASPEVRKESAREMEDLRRKRDVLRDKLAKVKSVSPDAWADLKTGIGEAADDLQRAYDRARSRFNK